MRNSFYKKRKNVITNPSMDIWQRGELFNITTSSYTADRVYSAISGSGAIEVSKVKDSPNSFSEYCYQFKNKEAVANLAANAYSAPTFNIEGYDIRELIGKNVCFSFYAKSKKTGLYSVGLRLFKNTDVKNVYTSTFKISKIDTWEKIVISLAVPESDYNLDASLGMSILIGLASGENGKTDDLNTWRGSENAWISRDNVNFLEDVNNTFKITQVQMHEGQEPIPFAELVRPIQEEEELCMRYYEKLEGNVYHSYTSGVWTYLDWAFKVRKRAVPVVVFSAGSSGGVSTPTRDNVQGRNTGGHIDIRTGSYADAEL